MFLFCKIERKFSFLSSHQLSVWGIAQQRAQYSNVQVWNLFGSRCCCSSLWLNTIFLPSRLILCKNMIKIGRRGTCSAVAMPVFSSQLKYDLSIFFKKFPAHLHGGSRCSPAAKTVVFVCVSQNWWIKDTTLRLYEGLTGTICCESVTEGFRLRGENVELSLGRLKLSSEEELHAL